MDNPLYFALMIEKAIADCSRVAGGLCGADDFLNLALPADRSDPSDSPSDRLDPSDSGILEILRDPHDFVSPLPGIGRPRFRSRKTRG